MKKALSIIILLTILLALAGCAEAGPAGADPSSSQSTTDSTDGSTNSETGSSQTLPDESATTPTADPVVDPMAPATAPTETESPAPTACSHSYQDATCTAPKTCTKCGATSGSAAGHSYKDATCSAPKTCTKCSATEGKALGHAWKDATCSAPKTCSRCSATEGSVGTHNFVNDVCSVCSSIDCLNPAQNILKEHDYVGPFNEATCTAPALYFADEGCFVTTRYFTTDPEEASSGGWDYNGSHYYSEGGGFTPYRSQITDTELIVTTVSYQDDTGDVSIKAVLLKNGNLRITYSTNSDYPVGLILFADIADAFQ